MIASTDMEIKVISNKEIFWVSKTYPKKMTTPARNVRETLIVIKETKIILGCHMRTKTITRCKDTKINDITV